MWELIREDSLKEQYIKPVGENHLDSLCWCNPKLEIVNGWKIITHNSLDGRERTYEIQKEASSY